MLLYVLNMNFEVISCQFVQFFCLEINDKQCSRSRNEETFDMGIWYGNCEQSLICVGHD